jgi:superfamily II DNA or RNA helicase
MTLQGEHYDSVLSEKGLIIKIDHIRSKFPDIKKFNKFLRIFTTKENIQFRRNNNFCREKILKAYKTIDSYLILPKSKLQVLTKTGIINNTKVIKPYEPTKITNDLTMTHELYDYQEQCIKHLTEDHLYDTGIAYFSLGTGLGKTKTAIGLISRLKVKTLVIVPSSKDLQSQWIDELAFTLPDVKCLAYSNNMKKGVSIDDYDVIITVVNTFCKKTLDFVLEGKFGLVIIDEAHEFCSTVYSNSLWLIQPIPYILGLSATPHARKDELDFYVDQFLGPPIIADNIPGVNINKEKFHGTVTRINYCGHPDFCDVVLNDNGDINNALTLRQVVTDPHRIQLIIDNIRELYDDSAEHGIFIFAEHRDYLQILRDRVLAEFGEDNVLEDYDKLNKSDVNIQVLRGGACKNLVKHVRSQGARIVLTTYGYSRRGIDLPNMTAMILVTPRRSGLMQVLGRITRKRSDLTKIRHVIDVVDYSTIYKKQFYDRKEVYDTKEWPITKKTIDYESIDV